MAAIETDVGETHIAVGWTDVAQAAHGQLAVEYATRLAAQLVAAGYQPRRLEIGLRRGRLGILELLLRGDVPGMAEHEFVSLAKLSLTTQQLAHAEPIVLWPRLAPQPTTSEQLAPPPAATPHPVATPPPAATPHPVATPPPAATTHPVATPPPAVSPGPAATLPPAATPRPATTPSPAATPWLAGTPNRGAAPEPVTSPGRGATAEAGGTPEAGGHAGGADTSPEAAPAGAGAGRAVVDRQLRRVRVAGREFPIWRVVVGLLAGCALGVLGLPRLDVQLPAFMTGQPGVGTSMDLATPEPQLAQTPPNPATPNLQAQPTPNLQAQPTANLQGQPTANAAQGQSTPNPQGQPTANAAQGQSTVNPQGQPTANAAQGTPTRGPALPTFTREPTVSAQAAPGSLFAERFVSPLPNWPNNPQGMAWFANGEFRMFARQPGRFVNVGVPLNAPVRDAVISAQFHKVGGPAGGGYGLVVRDQYAWSEVDTNQQLGEFIVLEVGDRGEVGIWQRAATNWVDIVGWTHSDAVHPDREANIVAVTLRDGSLRFEVNGEVVANVDYNGLPAEGGVGIFTGGDLNEVVLDWLRIEALHN